MRKETDKMAYSQRVDLGFKVEYGTCTVVSATDATVISAKSLSNKAKQARQTMMNFPLFLTTSLAFSFLKSRVSATSVSHPVVDSHRHKLRSTGTTIAGVCLPSGVVVLGADTRATDDRIVVDKYCSKIHFLANGIYACGAGTSGDLGE